VDDFVFEECINEQPCIDINHVYEQLGAEVTIVPEIDIFNSYFLYKIIDLKVDHRYERQPLFDEYPSDDEQQAYLVFDHYEDSKDDTEVGLVTKDIKLDQE
jgi:hypothetical protein